ncbi:hypothetical protein CLV71_13415 [Actinophytocola oryzae]|uniref:Uncharacterized protein n=1 Tax=Actinophytocola oryzae TaxID=502181 RepID=A0A4R7UQW6_9PSEU|nr:hypothetical protein CLV71_13415 [Actinophytocola oryzae]
MLAVDLRRYSHQPYRGQRDAQNRLRRLVGYVLRRCGLSTVRVQRQEQGDGQLVIFPAWADDTAIAPALILGLRDGLYHLNLFPGASGRIRMRAALAQSPVWRSANGYIGEGIVDVSRLVDSAEVRTALETTDRSDLALAVTSQIHRGIALLRPPGLSLAEFQRTEVAIPAKEYRTEAWLHVPDSGPAPDTREGGVRWGESAARRAMNGYALPTIAILPLAIAARQVATRNKVEEWALTDHRGRQHPAADAHDSFDEPRDHGQRDHHDGHHHDGHPHLVGHGHHSDHVEPSGTWTFEWHHHRWGHAHGSGHEPGNHHGL